MKTIAIQFARFGPYHLARIAAAVKVLSNEGWGVVGLETAGTDSTYAWREEAEEQPWKRRTVFPNEKWDALAPARVRQGMFQALNEINPEAVLISGWGSADARACLDWCRKNGARSIVASETREGDSQRVWWKEWLKGRLVRRFDAALVGGNSHRDYLVKLGIPRDRIQLGYDVVDNEFFSNESRRFRKVDTDLQVRPYFLASNRFIERKNLSRLIDAYASCRGRETADQAIWDLCLLGDGDLKAALIAQCRHYDFSVKEVAPWESTNGVSENRPVVFFPGFRQIEELSRFYAHAGCFVHPASQEPWGLVINEAMASQLPVISSSNVGAAEELIDTSINGWTFNPEDTKSIADCLNGASRLPPLDLNKMGHSSARILEERCSTRRFGESLHAILNPVTSFPND